MCKAAFFYLGVTFKYYPVNNRSVMQFALKHKNVKKCIRMGIIVLNICHLWGRGGGGVNNQFYGYKLHFRALQM